MARTPDPARREQLLDAIVVYLAENGLAALSMRPLAAHLGQSTRVLTHHFRDKQELLEATLRRLDQINQEWLRAQPDWQSDRPLGEVLLETWEWQLDEPNRPLARLFHEIEGMAASGRLGDNVPALFADRLEYVRTAIEARGVPSDRARELATFLNAAYTGLRADFLTSGDSQRVKGALGRLAEAVDHWIEVERARRDSAN